MAASSYCGNISGPGYKAIWVIQSQHQLRWIWSEQRMPAIVTWICGASHLVRRVRLVYFSCTDEVCQLCGLFQEMWQVDASDEVRWVCWSCVLLYWELWKLERCPVTKQTSSGFLWNYRWGGKSFLLSEQRINVAGRDSPVSLQDRTLPHRV